jgi:hypothetical protein
MGPVTKLKRTHRASSRMSAFENPRTCPKWQSLAQSGLMGKTNLIDSFRDCNVTDFATNYALQGSLTSRPDQFELPTHKMFFRAEGRINTQ